jgi:hypothetical protein
LVHPVILIVTVIEVVVGVDHKPVISTLPSEFIVTVALERHPESHTRLNAVDSAGRHFKLGGAITSTVFSLTGFFVVKVNLYSTFFADGWSFPITVTISLARFVKEPTVDASSVAV